MSLLKLKKRVLQLEDHFPSGDDDEELGLDWDRIPKEDQDVLIAGARIDIKYRRKGPGPRGFIFDYEEATQEEKALRKRAQAVLEQHLEKTSEIQKRERSF